MTYILLKRGDMDTETDTHSGALCEDMGGGRIGGMYLQDQGKPKIAGKPPEARRLKGRVPTDFRGSTARLTP